MTLASVPRYVGPRPSTVGGRAVVVGGSVAGLLAARVLSDAFGAVTVLECDALPDGPTARRGAPQTNHPHALLEAGRATLEDLLPGFGEALLARGGLMIDISTDFEYYDEGGFLADPPSRLPMYCATRPLFEHVVRERVAAIENVRLRGNCQFTDYRLDDVETTVTGVAFRDEDGRESGLAADLVVDATGRTSRTPNWLAANGFPPPAVEEVAVDVTYSTIRVERPPDDRRVLFAPPDAPRTRGGVAIPAEGDTWEVIVQGVHGDDAPADADGFVEFAESLPVEGIGRIVHERAWVSEAIHHYPFPSSRRRRYEGLDRFPAGLVVAGDAIASFNPVYGQGMSVAALDALSLHHALADGGLEGLPTRYFGRTGEVIDAVWGLAVGADFDFAQTTGPKPPGTDLLNRYVDRLTRRAHDDGELSEVLYRVIRLEQPPSALLRPRVLWRTLRPRGVGRGPSAAARAPEG